MAYKSKNKKQIENPAKKDIKPIKVSINLAEIESVLDLHFTFKEKLNFPDFYGMNWDAFWDTITGLTEMPNELILTNFKIFKTKFLKDSEVLKKLALDFNKENVEEISIIN